MEEKNKKYANISLFKYIHNFRLNPANGIEHKVYMLIDKNSL